MKSQINILRQLQELVLTRDEHFQSGDGSHLDQLNTSISSIQKKLLPQVSAVYERLYAKSHIVTAATTGGCCSVCGMQVPIAQIQQVKLAQHLVSCTSCGRILFEGDVDEPRHIPDKSVTREETKNGISRFSAPELMAVDLGKVSCEESIQVLAKLMEQNKFIENADSLVAAAMQREGVLSTAIGEGVAFPHVRGVEGGGLTLAIGTSKEGIDWDGEKVHIVVLSAIPVAVSAFYLRLMAGLAKCFSKKDVRDSIIESASPEALWKLIVKTTKREIK
ncbi:MAG: PTS sugar transporter subunit IIA [Kiritimatiellae bacterium]|nr:PTS sugar transporter subunit IIA [Kiritimatiellia bacterium]